MRRSLAAILVVLSFVASGRSVLAKETPLVDRPLPVDDRYAVRETLPTGLRLYVRRHETPKGQVGLWLHVGTGSLNEEEHERGLAHFLEHMAFRGSANFPPGTLTPRFEELGVRFGKDQNALTSFDQTTYQIGLPRTDPASIAECLLYLSDVAYRLSLIDSELDDERGVVMEEARARAGAQIRILERLLDLMAPGSRVASRLPIGLMKVIEKVDAKTMRGYWTRWYRPENSTLMIVGDIDPATVAAMARLAFADWRSPGDSPKPAEPGLIVDGPRRSAVITDPELTQADLTWIQPRPLGPSTTYAHFRTWLIDHLSTWIVNQRLNEMQRRGDAPFQSASWYLSPYVAGAEAAMFDVQSPPGRWRDAAEALLVEWRRVQQHGVLAAEMDRAKKALLANLAQAVETAAGVPTFAVLNGLNQLVTNGWEPMSEAQRLDVARELLPGIVADEVSTNLRTRFALDGGLLVLILPEKAGFALPKPEELDALVAKVGALDVPPPASSSDVDHLVAPQVAESAVETRFHADLGVTSASRPNGARWYIRPLPEAGSAHVQIRLLGGICDEDASNRGITALAVAALDGDGKSSASHDASAIAAWRIGKSFQFDVGRDGDSVSISIGGTAADLEVGLELAHLLLAEGVVTDSALRVEKETLLQNLEDAARSTQQQAIVRLRQRIGGDDPRLGLPRSDTVGRIDAKAATAWWTRLAREAPIEVVVSGKIAADDAAAMLHRWIDTLPARPADAWEKHLATITLPRRLAPGGENIHVATITPTSFAVQGWVGLDRTDPMQTVRAQHAAMILTSRLLKEVRETRGLTYSIQAFPLVTELRGIETFAIVFTADKDRIEEAAKIAYDTAVRLRDEGPTVAEVASIDTQMALGLRNEKQLPGFWLGLLSGASTVPGGLDVLARSLAASEAVDIEATKALLAALVKDENYLHVLARPAPPANAPEVPAEEPASTER